MTNTNERVATIEQRVQTLLAGLNITPHSPTLNRDLQVLRLLLEAADYTACGADLAQSVPVLALLIDDEELSDLEGFSGEGAPPLILLGIGLGGEEFLAHAPGIEDFLAHAAGIVETGAEHTHDEHSHDEHTHSGSCISPDPSALFPQDDVPADEAQSTTVPAEGETAGDEADDAALQNEFAAALAGEMFLAHCSSEIGAVAEELFARADALLTRAEELKSLASQSGCACGADCSCGDDCNCGDDCACSNSASATQESAVAPQAAATGETAAPASQAPVTDESAAPVAQSCCVTDEADTSESGTGCGSGSSSL